MIRVNKAGLLIIAIATFTAMTAGDILWAQATQTTPDTSAAQSYRVAETSDFSAGYGRTRKSLCIVSDAERFTARAHTIMRAAIRFQQETGADYVQVAMTPIDGIGCGDYFTAIAEYAPDGGGVTGDETNHFWQVKATDIVLDIEERLVLRAWQEAKPQFSDNGDVDIERMKAHLAAQLNLSPEEVEDFWLKGVEMGMTLRRYPVQ